MNNGSHCKHVIGDMLDGGLDDIVFVKHDVECDIDRALDVATIENSNGIRSTYYFQFDVFESNVDKVRKIADLGHEIAYHYDVLDAAKGDVDLAIKTFIGHINVFNRHGYDVKTVCPHGNPLMERRGWDSNKDFFRSKNVRDQVGNFLDVVVDWNEYFTFGSIYVSDAGYKWKIISNISENDRINSKDLMVHDLGEIIDSKKSLVLSTHPHRWRKYSSSVVAIRLRFYVLRLIGKFLGRSKTIRKLLTPFYSLARRF
ncbi:MAG: hypothetical protein WD512_10700 [Candidatus Paceibacterota bacterium]